MNRLAGFTHVTALDIIRWVFAGLLGAVWLPFAGGNRRSAIGAAIPKGSTSFVLFFGGVAGYFPNRSAPTPDGSLHG
jgi:hypothetical protein